MTHRLVHADCVEAMRAMPAESVDAIVTDPPYELGFMGKRWDASGIAYSLDLWREALRVLKPGGHLVSFGGTRTYHRMACAVEDAGFEIRDSLHWMYGSGFPKSLDVAKAIDKRLGATREVVGERHGSGLPPGHLNGSGGSLVGGQSPATTQITASATSEAQAWDGWGTALKPAHEPIVLARKPLTGTVAENVLAQGTGGLNVAACRIGSAARVNLPAGNKPGGNALNLSVVGIPEEAEARDVVGRWPPNVLLTHSPGCMPQGTRRVKTGTAYPGSPDWKPSDGWGHVGMNADAAPQGYADTDGLELVVVWDCVLGCPVAALDAQSGESASPEVGSVACVRAHPGFDGQAFAIGARVSPTGHGDAGGASRFFPTFTWDPELDVPFIYVPKPPGAERDVGLHDLEAKSGNEVTGRKPDSPGAVCSARAGVTQSKRKNIHPTVKPVALMEWLVRLVTPKGGTVLDPFLGSGTTGMAAVRMSFDFVGIEREAEYVAIAERRIALAANAPRAKPLAKLERAPDALPGQTSLFDKEKAA